MISPTKKLLLETLTVGKNWVIKKPRDRKRDFGHVLILFNQPTRFRGQFVWLCILGIVRGLEPNSCDPFSNWVK